MGLFVCGTWSFRYTKRNSTVFLGQSATNRMDFLCIYHRRGSVASVLLYTLDYILPSEVVAVERHKES